MPATFAHPAFVWPLARRGFPFAALAVGSMIPDLGHLLPRSAWTDHTARSVLAFSLPLGLLLHLGFARAVAEPLSTLAPKPWRDALHERARALAASSPFGPRVVLSVALGAALHVAIDACTHRSGAVVAWAPGLFRATLVETPLGSLALYQLLQYGGGLAGSAFLAAHLAAWGRAHRARPARARDFLGVGGLTLGIGVLSSVYAHGESHWLEMPTRLHVFLVQGAVGMILLFCASAVVLAGAVRCARRLGARRA